MGRGRLIYHGYGVDIPWVGGQNTMGKGVKMPCVGGSKYHV